MLEKPFLASVTLFSNSQVNKISAGRTMGSTLVAAHFTKNSLDIAHVGDSRLYLWRKGQLTQLTEDHSLVYELFKLGKITQEDMLKHQMRNVITRAIGANTSVEPTLGHIDVSAGDIYLLCSDGLTNMLAASDMINIFENESCLSSLGQSFITKANDAGGRDNITVLLISVQKKQHDSQLPVTNKHSKIYPQQAGRFSVPLEGCFFCAPLRGISTLAKFFP